MEFLAPLALLACPIGMVLMMWFMGRSVRGSGRGSAEAASAEDLRAEQARLAAEIERLETRDTDMELAGR